ncbi:hypothetical protein AAT17_01330 [Nonlabens sp. MIC269]|uniref:DUF5683 domain-containing protein n=1 Tax=Nonlabens TaxID=363408 RepID=UPI0007220697|nr:DUF5683 domain-containing protein [Nonlabens sp. MIC269]ALM19989.1 hypothetical protein AAT17_01330 [Nonlabens sp. MIC269]
MVKHLVYIFIILSSAWCHAQDDSNDTPEKQDLNTVLVANDTLPIVYDANRPSKAAFYSAILPGMGQVYNKKYWKVPIAYGLIGTSVYFYIRNDNEYNRLRDAFKIRLAGGTNDEFSDENGNPIISTQGLERAQKVSQRNKELSLLLAAAAYVLQIIDANVDGHLSQFSVDRNLAVLPYIDYNNLSAGSNFGFSLTYNF